MNDFEQRLADLDERALYAVSIEQLQLNLGLRCNLRCAHCHHSSDPERNEAMSDEVFAAALQLAQQHRPTLIDLTGGAPELHPSIRAFVRAARDAGFEVQLRTNLSAMLEPGCQDLPELWASLGVRLLASFPSTDAGAVARQRGDGAWESSLAMLRRLNHLGYGAGGGLVLDLACNPDAETLPDPSPDAEQRFRRDLAERHGICFDARLVLTNMPLGRFWSGLGAAARSAYLGALRTTFNPATVPQLACRRSLAVAWDGVLYDCDFNLAAGLPVQGEQRSVFAPPNRLEQRRLAFGTHCFACTAAAGSS